MSYFDIDFEQVKPPRQRSFDVGPESPRLYSVFEYLNSASFKARCAVSYERQNNNKDALRAAREARHSLDQAIGFLTNALNNAG